MVALSGNGTDAMIPFLVTLIFPGIPALICIIVLLRSDKHSLASGIAVFVLIALVWGVLTHHTYRREEYDDGDYSYRIR